MLFSSVLPSRREYDERPAAGSTAMNGWALDAYEDGRSLVLKLPYIDKLSFRAVADAETRRLQIHNGEFDHVHGPFASITLADVEPLRRNRTRPVTGCER
jgi:ABC-type transport system substrate-binding protein